VCFPRGSLPPSHPWPSNRHSLAELKLSCVAGAKPGSGTRESLRDYFGRRRVHCQESMQMGRRKHGTRRAAGLAYSPGSSSLPLPFFAQWPIWVRLDFSELRCIAVVRGARRSKRMKPGSDACPGFYEEERRQSKKDAGTLCRPEARLSALLRMVLVALVPRSSPLG